MPDGPMVDSKSRPKSSTALIGPQNVAGGVEATTISGKDSSNRASRRSPMFNVPKGSPNDEWKLCPNRSFHLALVFLHSLNRNAACKKVGRTS